jgi:hypothetical protein
MSLDDGLKQIGHYSLFLARRCAAALFGGIQPQDLSGRDAMSAAAEVALAGQRAAAERVAA